MTQDELKELVSDDAETGVFKRLKQTSPRIKVGQSAGYVNCKELAHAPL